MNNFASIDYTHVPNDKELEQLVQELETTFKANMHRHEGLLWTPVERRIAEISTKTRDVIRSLNLMVKTQGMPDVVGFDQETGKFRFRDCSPESPEGRRYLAYDKAGESEFKKYYLINEKCNGNVLDTAATMGIDVLNELEYRKAQIVDELDRKSWSYIKTLIDLRGKSSPSFGRRDSYGVLISGDFPHIRHGYGAFRGALWV
jgi:hypothetical protein